MLEEYGLAMAPGDVFGAGYGQHVRIAYGGSLETQKQAAQIFREALAGMAKESISPIVEQRIQPQL